MRPDPTPTPATALAPAPAPNAPGANPLATRASGVLLHLTSLPGPHGIGDFGPDAHHFVDWLASAGQRLWQWLPTTPIGPGDSPYQSVSAFAGSPLMVALQPLVAQGWLAEPVLPDGGFAADHVDYARVVPWRMARLREAAAGFKARATAAERAALATWAQAQAHWLDDYTLFMALEAAHGGAPWWQWPEPLRRRQPQALAAARADHAEEIAFWRFVQWCFDVQCAELKRYANARGVALMGDLPIFVAHHSADCWARPELYRLDADHQPQVVAGVPPDELGPEGQRWGNPLYDWLAMAKDGYAWWTARLQRALSQADVFRIDHFRGFAAYYEIPADAPDALSGRWRRGPGLSLFEAITARLGPLPIVGEDLGFITPDVQALRQACGFPGMKVLLFAFGGGPDHAYLPHQYTPDAVVYTGTHDTDTVRGWWDAADARVQRFAGTYLACSAADVHWAMLRAALNSVARLAIFPLQDVLGLGSAHRMNLPGTMGGRNWAWRFHWGMVGPEPGRVLGVMTAAAGRGPFNALGLGDAPAAGEPAEYPEPLA